MIDPPAPADRSRLPGPAAGGATRPKERGLVLALVVLALGGLARLGPGHAAPSAPSADRALGPGGFQDAGQNLLLIIGDDLSVETLGAYGLGANPARTPRLDALIQEGVLFRSAWAYPLCTPFRAAALTGRFGFRTGVGSVGAGAAAVLPQAELIIPEVLDLHPELNVAHAAIGKWHLTQLRDADAPNTYGFAHYAGSLGVVASFYDWQRTVNGQTARETGYATSVQVDDAIAWITSQERPWFTYLAFNAPHEPFHRPPEGLHTVALPPGEYQRGADATPYFQAALEAMDHEIGRLLDALDPEVRARTNIIFMGDNGSPQQAVQAPFGRLTSKSTLYQGGLWTPLLVSGPAVSAPGRSVEALVSSVDLFATTLELLGVAPGDWPSQTDSVSLVPYLSRPDQPPLREWAFSEMFGNVNRPAENGKAIRDAGYKYIRFDDGREAFFDLQTDPYESRNLAGSALGPDQAAALAALKLRLDTLLNNPPQTPSAAATATAAGPGTTMPPPLATGTAATLTPSPTTTVSGWEALLPRLGLGSP